MAPGRPKLWGEMRNGSVEKRGNGTFFEEAFWVGRVPFCKVIPGISKDIVMGREGEGAGERERGHWWRDELNRRGLNRGMN